MADVTIVEELLIREKKRIEDLISSRKYTVVMCESELSEAQEGLAYARDRYVEIIQSLEAL